MSIRWDDLHPTTRTSIGRQPTRPLASVSIKWSARMGVAAHYAAAQPTPSCGCCQTPEDTDRWRLCRYHEGMEDGIGALLADVGGRGVTGNGSGMTVRGPKEMPTYTRSYHTIPDDVKQSWGDGPWVGEIDKAQWVDEKTGLDCLIVRNMFGVLCGYVGVGEDHRLFGVGYNECTVECGDAWCSHSPDGMLRVHGGITYSEFCQEREDESVGICHVPLDGRPEQVWWFGFDMAHAGDRVPTMPYAPCMRDDVYRDEAYVRNECADLAKQLAAIRGDK